MKLIQKCSICGGGFFKPYGKTVKGSGLHFSQIKCVGCGLIISQPQAEKAEMDAFYQKVYYQEKWPESTVELNSDKFHLGKLFRLLGREYRSARVLDVGCGYGKTLSLFKELGNDCYGCDISQKAVEYAKKHFGLDHVVCGDASFYQEEPFDLVISSHVIEHLPDPVSHLDRLKQLTKPGGRIVVGTENSESSQLSFERTLHRLKGGAPKFITSQEHTYVFSAANLSRLFQLSGLHEVKALCYNEVPREENLPESFHWFLYKGSFRFIDRLLGLGSYLLVAGRK